MEIIGHRELLADVLHIAAGNDSHLQADRIVSDLNTISGKITPRVQAAIGA